MDIGTVKEIGDRKVVTTPRVEPAPVAKPQPAKAPQKARVLAPVFTPTEAPYTNHQRFDQTVRERAEAGEVRG